MNKITLLAGLLFLTFPVFAESVVTGFVYEDANNNGVKDRNEKGVPGVAVSNGVAVTQTDASGAYRLSVGEDNVIFVIKPAGYKTAIDSFNCQKAYYIHKPAGSPELHFKGIAPTGALPKSLNFALTKYDEPEAFTSLIFGDSQIYNDAEASYLLRGVVEDAKQAKGVSFGITLGDLVGDTLPFYPAYKNAIKQIGVPWYNVTGNHDMNHDVTDDRLSNETFKANFGPANYAFNYGKAHFIVLDDIIQPNPATGRGYIGGMRDEQFEFLENDLKYVSPNSLIVISMHIPLLEEGRENLFRANDRQHFFMLLKNYPNVLFLTAHTHIQCQNFFRKVEGFERSNPIHEYNVGTTCGDWYSGPLNKDGIPVTTMRDGTPLGYAFLRVDGNKYQIDYKVYDKPDTYRISIYNPKVVPAGGGGSTIYANFFMGSNEDTLESRIDGGEWTKLRWTKEPDPAYARYVQDWDYIDKLIPGRRPSNPIISSHLWKGWIPHNLAVGEHRIEIRATDIFGRTYTGTSSYKIEKIGK